MYTATCWFCADCGNADTVAETSSLGCFPNKASVPCAIVSLTSRPDMKSEKVEEQEE